MKPTRSTLSTACRPPPANTAAAPTPSPATPTALTWYDGTTTKTSHYTTGTNLLTTHHRRHAPRAHLPNSSSGNMATDDRASAALALSNTYGGRDRLESMTVGTPTYTFKINALGQRVSKAIRRQPPRTSCSTSPATSSARRTAARARRPWNTFGSEGSLLAQIDSSGNYCLHLHRTGEPAAENREPNAHARLGQDSGTLRRGLQHAHEHDADEP